MKRENPNGEKCERKSPCETTNELIVLKKMTRKILSKETCDIYMYATFYSNKQESEKEVSIVCIVKPLKIRKFNIERFGLIAAFLAFMALGSNSFDCLNSYVQMVHIRQKIFS